MRVGEGPPATSSPTASPHTPKTRMPSLPSARVCGCRTLCRLCGEPGPLLDGARCGLWPRPRLARFADRGHRVIGIDLNRDFVDMARAHRPVVLGDLRAMPFCAATFDAVWASASLIHLPHEDAAVALGEIACVARAGAPVSVSVKTGGVTGWADDLPEGGAGSRSGSRPISPERSRTQECRWKRSWWTTDGSKSGTQVATLTPAWRGSR